MPGRLRKLIGLFAILGFFVLYVVVASTVSDYVPDHWAARMVYYALAGTLWGGSAVPADPVDEPGRLI